MKLLAFLNLGNTCYLNSVLQCFINDTLFHEIKVTENFDEFSSDLKTIVNMIEFDEPEKHFCFKFNNIHLLKHFSSFGRFQQHDAHEFLVSFLDKLKIPKSFYHGQTVNRITCNCCNTQKLVYEDFNTINLTCKDNLNQSFEEYLKTEIHDDPENLYFCEICNKNTITNKKLFLNLLPKRLIIVLKRYNLNFKINNLINYPNDLLIKETNTSEIKKYNLVSVIHHLGNLTDGHYTNSVKINNNWYFMDDELIQLDEDIKCDINAYILMYAC